MTDDAERPSRPRISQVPAARALAESRAGDTQRVQIVRASPPPPRKGRPVVVRPERDPRPTWARVSLFEIRIVRELIGGIGLALGVYLVYVLRAATGPALLALSLAYLFQPVLHRAEEAWGWSRTVTTVMVVVGLVTVTTALGVFIIPETLEDLGTLTRDLPGYVEQVAAQLGVEGPVAERLELGDGAAGLFPQDSQEVLDQVLGIFGAVTRALGVTAYFVLAGLFTTALFVWWSITFERLPTLVSYLPASRREEIGDLLTEFEQAFGGFLRGQILVALFTSVGFALGFSLIGVPHAFAAAAIGGLMSFIPNGQIAGPASAIAFGVLGAAPAGHIDWVTVALLPGLVYAVTQSLETFVVTPLVQGSYTRLHPLAVFGALLAGGAVGGIIGVFLAVPLTACLRILLQQVILPRIRRAADVR